MQRILSLDIARAICIILVVIGHYYPENSPGWYDSLHGLIYSFHMPLFMFASGYVYMATNKERNYGKFVWKKVKRLMIPYVVTSFIVITLKLLMEGNAYVQNPVSLDSYLRVFYGPSGLCLCSTDVDGGVLYRQIPGYVCVFHVGCCGF